MGNVSQLKASLAICAAMQRFCESLNARDWEGCREVMTKDFQLDISSVNGIPVIRGGDTAMAKVRSELEMAAADLQLQGASCRVHGNKADAIFVMCTRMIFHSERPPSVELSDLHERWVCLKGEWKLSRLKRVPSSAKKPTITNAGSMIQ